MKSSAKKPPKTVWVAFDAWVGDPFHPDGVTKSAEEATRWKRSGVRIHKYVRVDKKPSDSGDSP